MAISPKSWSALGRVHEVAEVVRAARRRTRVLSQAMREAWALFDRNRSEPTACVSALQGGVGISVWHAGNSFAVALRPECEECERHYLVARLRPAPFPWGLFRSLGDAARMQEVGLSQMARRAKRTVPEIPEAVVGAVVSLFRHKLPWS